MGTFYARKLEFGTQLDLNLQLCARVAPGLCPGVGGVGLGFQRAWAFVFQLHLVSYVSTKYIVWVLIRNTSQRASNKYTDSICFCG